MTELRLERFDPPTWQLSLPTWCDEPWFDGRLLQAHALGTGQELVLLHVCAPRWRGWYPLLLSRGPITGAILARTPPFGGPLLEGVGGDGAQRVGEQWRRNAATQFRLLIEQYLDRLGVASEVYLLADWLPGAAEIQQAWSAASQHWVAVSAISRPEDCLRSAGLRAELARAQRSLRISWRPFSETNQATEFETRIAATLRAVGAPKTAVPQAGYFQALVEQAPRMLWECRAEGPDGGAVQLFAQRGGGAQYLYSGRWGAAPGSSSLALWQAQRHLAGQAVHRLCLGGGTTENPWDSLLAFKARHADFVCRLAVGGRSYRPEQHGAAVRAGEARPLPGSGA